MIPQRNPDVTDMRAFVSNNVPWRDHIYVDERGSPATLSGINWIIQIRKCADSDSADLTLSTDNGKIDVVSLTNDDGDSVSVLRIDNIDVSAYEGDYYLDFVMVDVQSNETHLASGMATFVNAPAQV